MFIFDEIKFLLFPYANFNSSCEAGVKRPSPLWSGRSNQSLVLSPGTCISSFSSDPLGTKDLIFSTNKRV